MLEKKEKNKKILANNEIKNNIIKQNRKIKNIYKKSMNEIDRKNHLIFWVYKNNIRELLKYKLVILDFSTFL